MGDVTTGGSSTTPNSKLVSQTGDTLLKGLQKTYKGGVDVYGKPLYVDPSSSTTNAWNAGTAFGNSVIGSNGYGAGQQAAQNSLGGVFSGYGAVADNNGLTPAQTGAMTGLSGIGDQYAGLAGAYDENAPGYARMRQQLLDDASTSTAALFGNSGRLGSGASVDKITEAGLNAIAPLDYSNYQRSVDNQYRSLDSQRGVIGDQFNMAQTGVGNTLAGLSGQAATAGAQFGMGQTALENRQNAVGLLGQIGASKDADALAKRMADADLYDKKKNADWEALGRASSILGGTAGAGGSTTTNSVPWWAALLGGGAVGAGTYKSIFGQ